MLPDGAADADKSVCVTTFLQDLATELDQAALWLSTQLPATTHDKEVVRLLRRLACDARTVTSLAVAAVTTYADAASRTATPTFAVLAPHVQLPCSLCGGDEFGRDAPMGADTGCAGDCCSGSTPIAPTETRPVCPLPPPAPPWIEAPAPPVAGDQEEGFFLPRAELDSTHTSTCHTPGKENNSDVAARDRDCNALPAKAPLCRHSSTCTNGIAWARSPSTEHDAWRLTASPRFFDCSLRAMLCTPVGAWLATYRLFRVFMTMLALVYVVLIMWEPGYTEIEAHLDQQGSMLSFRTRRRSAWLEMTSNVVACVFFFLLVHCVNLEIFKKSIWSFESLMIVGNTCLSHVAIAFNRYYVFEGQYDVTWQCLDMSAFLLVQLPLGVCIATADSWRLKRKNKAALLVLYFTEKIFLWYMARHGSASDGWLKENACFQSIICSSGHTGAWGLYLSSQLQIAVFLAKALYAYVGLGYPFAFIKPHYIDAKRRSGFADNAVVAMAQSRGLAASFATSAAQQGHDAANTAHAVTSDYMRRIYQGRTIGVSPYSRDSALRGMMHA